MAFHGIAEDPMEQHNRYDDPSLKTLRDEMDHRLTEWIVTSTMDGNGEKAYPYMTMTPEHPGHQRGWQRTYPANPWQGDIPVGLT